MSWWELIFKRGIKCLAIDRAKEINLEKHGKLNMLLLKQAYYFNKIKSGFLEFYDDLKVIQNEIEMWYYK